MITLPKVKLEKVCSDSDERPILCNPYLLANKTIGKDGKVETMPGQGTLMATNGFVLVVQPVQHGDQDTSGPIPNAAIKAAHKEAKREPTRLDLEEVERVECERLFPKMEQIIKGRPTEDLVSIALDADKLLALADALCERTSIYTKPLRYVKLTLSTSYPNAPILVEPTDGDSRGFGILMPLHIRG